VAVLVELGPTLIGSDHPPSTLDLVLNAAGAVVGAAIGYAVLRGCGGGRRQP
jgi:hypothetical protein